MINKMRKKFIIVSFLSVFALLAAILLVTNLVNFAMETSDADKVLAELVRQGGAFPKGYIPGEESGAPPPDGVSSEPENSSGGAGGAAGPESPEIGKTTRYFTVKFSADGTVTNVKLKMNAVSESEAINWASSLLSKKKGWSRTYYRYLVWQDGERTMVTVIDRSRELLPSYRVLVTSLIGVAIGSLITVWVLFFVSKAATAPIEKSDRKQKRFIRGASFELKDPIVAIDASRRALEDRIGKSAETGLIRKQIAHLSKVVQGLDTLLLLEEPRPAPKQDVDLSLMLRETLSLHEAEAASCGKTLRLSVKEGVTLRADPSSMQKLLDIALKNGIDYAETYLEIRLNKEEERISLEFINDAADLEDGPLDSLFERFYRSPSVRERVPDGAGLGLSIAKEIVSELGGRIRAEAKGGEFRLKIEL